MKVTVQRVTGRAAFVMTIQTKDTATHAVMTDHRETIEALAAKMADTLEATVAQLMMKGPRR